MQIRLMGRVDFQVIPTYTDLSLSYDFRTVPVSTTTAVLLLENKIPDTDCSGPIHPIVPVPDLTLFLE